jgi:tRNA A58 N-methylase Trm61
VADDGAGTGVLSLLFAEKVGAGGTVIAQDIAPEFLRGIEERARTDLGMVGSNETVFQVVPPQPAPAPPEEERRTAEATGQ